jgi:hypothetical protein
VVWIGQRANYVYLAWIGCIFALVRIILLFVEAKGWNGTMHGSPTYIGQAYSWFFDTGATCRGNIYGAFDRRISKIEIFNGNLDTIAYWLDLVIAMIG